MAAEDAGLESPIGAPVDTAEDGRDIRRPQHLKRDDPRAKEIEGEQEFRVNPEEARPADEVNARRRAARKRGK